MDFLNFNSVEDIPGITARAAFQLKTTAVFAPSGRGYSVVKEDGDITPVVVSDNLSYMPWGADNQMPYNVIDLIESDETLAICQLLNAEVCFESDSAPKARCCSNQGSDCGLSESRVVQLAEISLHCEFYPAVGRLFSGVASVGYRPIIRSSHFQELQEQPPAISFNFLNSKILLNFTPLVIWLTQHIIFKEAFCLSCC